MFVMKYLTPSGEVIACSETRQALQELSDLCAPAENQSNTLRDAAIQELNITFATAQ